MSGSLAITQGNRGAIELQQVRENISSPSSIIAKGLFWGSGLAMVGAAALESFRSIDILPTALNESLPNAATNRDLLYITGVLFIGVLASRYLCSCYGSKKTKESISPALFSPSTYSTNLYDMREGIEMLQKAKKIALLFGQLPAMLVLGLAPLYFGREQFTERLLAMPTWHFLPWVILPIDYISLRIMNNIVSAMPLNTSNSLTKKEVRDLKLIEKAESVKEGSNSVKDEVRSTERFKDELEILNRLIADLEANAKSTEDSTRVYFDPETRKMIQWVQKQKSITILSRR